jgi:hypothetical protein
VTDTDSQTPSAPGCSDSNQKDKIRAFLDQKPHRHVSGRLMGATPEAVYLDHHRVPIKSILAGVERSAA